jgi:hypothetical protein
MHRKSIPDQVPSQTFQESNTRSGGPVTGQEFGSNKMNFLSKETTWALVEGTGNGSEQDRNFPKGSNKSRIL